jgi:hypothetical protein
MSALPPNLCYTIALDQPGEDVHRRMARLLVASLIRTGWHGRVIIFHNSPQPVLPERHQDVEERRVAAAPDSVWHRTMSWKYRLRDQIDVTGFGKVLFLDCDIIALRDVNHLMMGSWDIYTAPEPGRITEFPFNGYLTDTEMETLQTHPGINAGTIGIRASVFQEVMAEWERLDSVEPLRPSKARDQHSWNRFVLDTRFRCRHFGPREVQFPFLHRAVWPDYSRAALAHAAADRTPEEKFALLYGLWAAAFGRQEFESLTAPTR